MLPAAASKLSLDELRSAKQAHAFLTDIDDRADAMYEKFMKLAEPYWMSCVTKNESTPILTPDHYRTWLERRS